MRLCFTRADYMLQVESIGTVYMFAEPDVHFDAFITTKSQHIILS